VPVKEHTHTLAIFPGEPELMVFPLDSASPYILFDTILPCPSQTGEGGEVMAVKEEKWSGKCIPCGVIGTEILRPDAFLSPTVAKDIR